MTTKHNTQLTPAEVDDIAAACAGLREPSPSVREAAEQIPKTTYKNKRQLSDDERFKLNAALNEYRFNNCDHEHDGGYPNHLICRWCALEIIAAITCSSVSAAGGDEVPEWSQEHRDHPLDGPD